MTQDNKDVQASTEEVKSEVVSPEGTTSTTGEKPSEVRVETPPQPLTEERIQQLIADAVGQGREKGRREMQSEQDIRVRDAIREANRLKRELADVNTSFAGLDEETKQGIELARYRAGEKGRQETEREEQQRRQTEETISSFKSNLSDYATEVGIDPSDKRLDYGVDYDENGKVVNLNDRQGKFLKSVAKVQKEIQKTEKETRKKELEDMELRLQKQMGVYSTDTGTSGGVGSKGIPTDMGKYKQWVSDLPLKEYEKLKPDIDKMMAEGKIK